MAFSLQKISDRLGLAAPDLGPSGQAQLLNMTAARYTAEAALFVIPLLLTWLYSRQGSAWLLIPWAVGMAALGVLMLWARRHLHRDAIEMSDTAFLVKWIPRSQKIALVYGASWAVPVVLTLGDAHFEFALGQYMVLAGITAAATNYLATIFGLFVRCFMGLWVVAVPAVCWMFPQHWYFMLPLTLLYVAVSFRHAQDTHKFLVRQIQLEERSAYLAERYKIAKVQAEQALDDKSQFLATASHDLRQPVHALGMLLETMAQRNQDASLEPLLGDMKSCVRSVNLMFNSLLDLSKIEAGMVPPQPLALRLGDLMDDIAMLFRDDAANRGLELRFHVPQTPAVVFADPSLLRQAIFNLTHNALRYTLRGGVLVAVRKKAGHWHIEVWDTGVGVADEEQERIYSPFYRNAQAWSVDSAGHGLGLAVVARCAKLMGATCGLASRLGKGSRFWLRLPAAPAPHGAQADALPGMLASMPQRLPRLSGTCLVVEDDPQVSAAWATLLQAWGVDARFATNAQEALGLLDQGFAPQAVLCDQRLRAGESGFEVLTALLARLGHSHGAMVSGEFNAPELVRAENEGYLVMRKPVEVAALHALLSRWMPDAAD